MKKCISVLITLVAVCTMVLCVKATEYSAEGTTTTQTYNGRPVDSLEHEGIIVRNGGGLK